VGSARIDELNTWIVAKTAREALSADGTVQAMRSAGEPLTRPAKVVRKSGA